MKSILLTNDDGINSPSLIILKDRLIDLAEITIVAPKKEKSWCGKEITRFGEFVVEDCGKKGYSVDGTPADCVLIGLFHILRKDRKPDLVISGINVGANAGSSFIFSSGTVGAAMEAALLGIPAIAISILIPDKHKKGLDSCSIDVKHFDVAADITKKITKLILSSNKKDLPSNLFIINVPYNANEKTKIKITSVGDAHYGSIFKELKEKCGETSRVFRFGAKNPKGAKFCIDEEDSDIRTLLVERSISITPISLNITGNIESAKKFFESLL
ncbi:MAG: 5'/3'-nucleotidase SurE [Candidatus Helarchaeota archaeon]